jgi:hypothetical protein
VRTFGARLWQRLEPSPAPANRDRLTSPTGERPAEGEYAGIGLFTGAGYQLEFCVHERVPSKAVLLVFDTDPDGDGEPLLKEDSPVTYERQRQSA